jgi:hypothetical protein
VRITNHGSKPATTILCTPCVTVTIAPGVTATLPADTWPAGSTVTVTSDQLVEARATTDAVPITLAGSSALTIPVLDPAQPLVLYALQAGTADILHLGTNGVAIARITVALNAGRNDVTTGFAPRLGEQVEIQASVPVIAWTETDGIIIAKAVAAAPGEQYLVRSDASTLIFVKNPSCCDVLAVSGNTLPPNQDNTTAANFQYAVALNAGTTVIRNLGYGSVVLDSQPVPGGLHPFNAWVAHHTVHVREEGATARSGLYEQTPKQSLSLNTLGSTVSLLNATRDPGTITGTITGFDDTGATTGTIPFTLRTKENTDVDLAPLHASRIRISADDYPLIGYPVLPSILASTTVNGEALAGFPIPRSVH